MGIRLPLQTILSFNDAGDVGASSTAGGVATTFTIPQDADNIVMKLTASLVGGSVSGTLQTTDDGGTTWYDVVRTPNATLANNTVAVWASAPVNGMGIRTTASGASSTATGTTQISVLSATGSAAASSLGVGQVSGLPILSQQGRVFLIYTGALATNDLAKVEIKVNSKSGTI